MTTIPDYSIEIGSFRSHRTGQNKDTTVEKRSIRQDSFLFDKLLMERINNTGKSNNMPGSAPPLTQAELLQLVEIIQMQMNNSLFNIFAESDKDTTFHEFNIDKINYMRQVFSPVQDIIYGSSKTEEISIQYIPENSVAHAKKGVNDRPTVNQIEQPASKIRHTSRQPADTGIIQSQTDINQIIERASTAHDVDPDLTKAVVRAESNFDPNSTSPKGAMGLMQLMPETAKDLGVKNAYNPVENVMAGTRYLKGLLERYKGNIDLALAAYNWGMGNLERHPGKLPRETRTYIARVNKYLNEAKI